MANQRTGLSFLRYSRKGIFYLQRKRVGKLSNITQSISWTDALEQFLLWKKADGVTETTLYDYQRFIRTFFERYDCWQSPDVKTCAFQYLGEKIKPATYNMRLVYLRAFFEWCMKEGYIRENPLDGLKRKKTEPRIVDIPEDALQRLLDLPDQKTYAGLRDYALIVFQLDCGARPKECLQLLVEHFDLNNRLVTIPAHISKTRQQRILPLMPHTVETIRRLIRVRPDWWDDEKVPVFCGNEGRQMNHRTWGDRLEFYSSQLGVKITPYALRHCFAIMYLRNGGDAFTLQAMMGHNDMSMTRRYLNITGIDLENAHRSASPLNRVLVKQRKRVTKIYGKRGK
jgi:site-specific recombinase XerD